VPPQLGAGNLARGQSSVADTRLLLKPLFLHSVEKDAYQMEASLKQQEAGCQRLHKSDHLQAAWIWKKKKSKDSIILQACNHNKEIVADLAEADKTVGEKCQSI
jgi:hypothetical protein